MNQTYGRLQHFSALPKMKGFAGLNTTKITVSHNWSPEQNGI